MSQDDLERFLQYVKEGQTPKEQIKELDEAGLLPQLLLALEGEKMLATRQMSDCYITTLIYMASLPLKNIPLPPEYETGIFQCSVYDRIYRSLLFYCQDIKMHIKREHKIFGEKVERIGELLLPLLAANFDVVLTAHLIGHDSEYHEDRTVARYDALFSHEEYDSLCKMFLERIERFQREGRVVGHVDFFDLFRCWRILLREYHDASLDERFKTACLPMTQDVKAINDMIRFFCDDNTPIDPVDLIVAIRLDDLSNAFGADGVEAIRTTLEKEPRLLEYTYKALVALRWALDQKRSEKLYGKDDQMNCFKELYTQEPIKSEMAARAIAKDSE